MLEEDSTEKRPALRWLRTYIRDYAESLSIREVGAQDSFVFEGSSGGGYRRNKAGLECAGEFRGDLHAGRTPSVRSSVVGRSLASTVVPKLLL